MMMWGYSQKVWQLFVLNKIDITGKEIIQTKYDMATSFSGGKADVWLDGKDLQIDKAGKIIQ